LLGSGDLKMDPRDREHWNLEGETRQDKDDVESLA
jgi:hypothetical protein